MHFLTVYTAETTLANFTRYCSYSFKARLLKLKTFVARFFVMLHVKSYEKNRLTSHGVIQKVKNVLFLKHSEWSQIHLNIVSHVYLICLYTFT